MNASLITVCGPRAGVGKSTFAMNFACALSRQIRGPILLIDFDPLDCGDLAIISGLRPKSVMTDLARNVFQLLPKDIINQIQPYNEKISILPGSTTPNGIAQIEPDNLEKLLITFASHYQAIIMDCGSELTEEVTAVLEHTSLTLFVTTPDILTLSRSVFSLAAFQKMAFSAEDIHLIINGYQDDAAVTEAIIKQKLRKAPLALLPDCRELMTTALQEGIPAFVKDPRAPFSQVMEKLVRHFLTQKMLNPMKRAQNSSHTLARKNVLHIDPLSPTGQDSPPEDQSDLESEIKRKIHQQLIDMMDFRRLTTEELLKQDERSIEALRLKTEEAIFAIIDGMPEAIASRKDRQRIANEVLNEALGLGPLEDLLADPDITEILVNRHDQIYVEKAGKLSATRLKFTTDRQLLGVIERIVAPIGRRIDEKTPMVDARLKDGSRVHAIIPPLALNGPMLTIRKFTRSILNPSHLIDLGAMTSEISDFLRACVQARLNILISGGTGTGKTTLLNVLASYIPAEERILTVEDSAELRLAQRHVGRLEARPPNLQGEGAIPIRELVRNTLRMRPDRIIVGECRGAEALDMLQAMNTGHDGSMTTIHANSPRDCVSRLETLVMFSGMELPARAIREQIASAIQLIVQLTRLSDGTRKVTSITEIIGLSQDTFPQVDIQDIFTFKERGIDSHGKVVGHFQATGLVPHFADRFVQKGIQMPEGLFSIG